MTLSEMKIVCIRADAMMALIIMVSHQVVGWLQTELIRTHICWADKLDILSSQIALRSVLLPEQYCHGQSRLLF